MTEPTDQQDTPRPRQERPTEIRSDLSEAAREIVEERRRREEAAQEDQAQGLMRDRTADAVGDMLGQPPLKATGCCHYCGLPLNRQGRCDECI